MILINVGSFRSCLVVDHFYVYTLRFPLFKYLREVTGNR